MTEDIADRSAADTEYKKAERGVDGNQRECLPQTLPPEKPTPPMAL